MDPQRFEQLSRLFAEACELEPQERAAFIDRHCAGDAELRRRLEAMLESDTNPTPFLEAPDEEPGEPPGAPHIERIGRFRVLGVLAAGGMGVVYEAEQDSPRRRVALKVMRRGAMSAPAVRRFRVEAELLGRLDHPGVARIYDAGVHTELSPGGIADEVPYFAMEFVQGRLITDAARRWPRARRLELMARVCDAVHHAHQRGVIHRDLKPSNILVTEEGNPKILDFGVARATDAEQTTLRTSVGQLIGTLAYMSPEQVGGDSGAIDARSDVYALGAVLYEILTGRPAHELHNVSIPEALWIVREADPAPLGARDRALRGELEVIVSTAMAKEPNRRYASAAELGADIRRHLRDEPIQARPASAIYQLRKLARRHRPAFVGLTVGAAAVLAAAIVSTVLAIELARQRNQARSALGDARQSSGFLLDLFLGSPDEPQVDRIALLQRAAAQLREQPPADTATRAKLHEYIGHGFLKVWSQAEAAEHLEAALALRESLAILDADLIKSTHLLAMQRIAAGRADEGTDLLRLTLHRRRELWGPGHMETNFDGELLWYIERYTPDEPEVDAEVARRRALVAEASSPGEPPRAPDDLPLIFEEPFGPGAPDRWNTELHDATGWDGAWEGRLLITDIAADLEQGQAMVRFARDLKGDLGDFWIQAHIGWDSLDRAQAAQTLQVGLLDVGRSHVTYLAYADGWIQHAGSRAGRIGQEHVLRHVAYGGHGTLPLSGEATLTMQRRAGEVTLWWNERVLLRGRFDAPVSEILLDFVAFQNATVAGTAEFGTLWIQSMTLHGAASTGP